MSEFEHLPTPTAEHGRRPAGVEETVPAGAEVDRQGDTLSRREAAIPSAGIAGQMDPQKDRDIDMKNMTEQELIVASYDITGGSLADFDSDQLRKMMTVTQYVTDLCLNELEYRGDLTFMGDVPIVPYQSEYSVETILTRAE